MDPITIIYYILGIIGLIVTVQSYRVSGAKALGMPKILAGIVGVGLIGFAVLQVGWLSVVGINPLSAGYVPPTVPQTPQVPQTPTPSVGASALIIDTFSVTSAKEKYSNAYDQVIGTLRFYDAGTNPSSPTASTVDTVTISAGTGSSTAKRLQTETPYRVVFDGASLWYDEDYGIITFASKDYNKNTGQYGFDAGLISRIANFTDYNASDISGNINGQTTATLGTDEIGTELLDDDSNGGNLSYDESVGDGQFYFDYIIEVSGANREVKAPVLCFEWDNTAPPEGNELSALTAQVQSGIGFGIPSDLLDYWSNQACTSMGTVIAGGASSEVRFTITVDEANLDTTDMWRMYIDDLGAIRGKDVRLGVGAIPNDILFTSQA